VPFGPKWTNPRFKYVLVVLQSVKCLLCAYVEMSDMKINYLKSDFVLLGEDNQRTEMLADLSVVIVTLQSLTLKFSCQPEGRFWWIGNFLWTKKQIV